METEINLPEKLALRGWLFTSHDKDLSKAEGHGSDKPGLSLEQIKERLKKGYPVIGAKCGVRLIDGRFSIIIDADAEGLFDWFEKNYPDSFGKTLTAFGSKKGHFYFETDIQPESSSIDKGAGGRAIDILGNGRMAVMPPSPHRKTGKPYQILRDADPLFIPWKELEAILIHAVSAHGYSWKRIEEKVQERRLSRDEVSEAIKHRITIFDLEVGLKPGLQSCPLPGHKHGDKNPSLSISGDGALFNCFSQHGGGDVFTWIMKRDNIDFIEAKKKLMEKAGIKARKFANHSDQIDDDDDMSKYIFDEDKILKTRQFTFSKISPGLFGIGLLLPKEKEIEDRKGNSLFTTQIDAPAIITSDGRLLSVSKSFENKYKIRFEVIPSNLPRRWSLDSIRRYLNRGYARIPRDEVFRAFKADYEKFLYFPSKEWYDVRALWDLGTYFFLLFKWFPLAELRGWPDSGKNRIIAVSRLHTFNPTEEMTNPSEATLFRLTHEQRPTKYLDECEKLFIVKNGKVESDDRVQLINSGYQHTGCVPRQEKGPDGKFRTVYYMTFSPSMLASINGLFGATERRAIVQITVRPPKEDGHANQILDENDKQYQDIRDKAHIFVLQYASEFEEFVSKFNLDDTDLKTRDRDQWLPILALAKFIDPSLYPTILKFAEKQAQLRQLEGISEGSFEYRILKAVKDLLESNPSENFIYAHAIASLCTSNDKTPSSKTITAILDKLGFREFKAHHENGNGYNLTPETFRLYILPLCPALFPSASSSSSASDDNNNINPEDGMKNPEEKILKKPELAERAEGNEANEGNEDETSGGAHLLGSSRHPQITPSMQTLMLWEELGFDAIDDSSFGALKYKLTEIGITQSGPIYSILSELVASGKIKLAEGFTLEAVLK